MYRLKQTSPEIDVVDGPLAGRKFKHGEVYSEIPEGDKGKFEEVVGALLAAPLSTTEGAASSAPTKGGKAK